jgi:hypothetical protein
MLMLSVTPSSLFTACQSAFDSIGVGGALVVQVVTVTSPPRPGVSATVLIGSAG